MTGLQKIIEEVIAKDKLMHFCISLLIAQLAYVWIWLIALPIVIGFVKEIYDRYIRKTGFNWWDLLATTLGIVPVLILYFLL